MPSWVWNHTQGSEKGDSIPLYFFLFLVAMDNV